MMMVLILGVVGCDQQTPSKAHPAPSPSGPISTAYAAGRAFGRQHQDDARISGDIAETSDPQGSVHDAVNADMDNARWWCEHNMPADLTAAHQDHNDALTAGCIGGVLPMFDVPGLWTDS